MEAAVEKAVAPLINAQAALRISIKPLRMVTAMPAVEIMLRNQMPPRLLATIAASTRIAETIQHIGLQGRIVQTFQKEGWRPNLVGSFGYAWNDEGRSGPYDVSDVLALPEQAISTPGLLAAWAAFASEQWARAKTPQAGLGAAAVFVFIAWCWISVVAGRFDPIEKFDAGMLALFGWLLGRMHAHQDK